MKKEEVILLLQKGERAIYRDIDNDALLSEILSEAFPLKEKRHVFLPDRFFWGKKETIWRGSPMNTSGLEYIKLSSIENGKANPISYEVLIKNLNDGKILYKKHHGDNSCIEFLFIEKIGNKRIAGIRGWGSAVGHANDRLLDILLNEDNEWKIFQHGDMKTLTEYPWSSKQHHNFKPGDVVSREFLSGTFTVAEVHGDVIYFKEEQHGNAWCYECQKAIPVVQYKMPLS